jgi:hypothetical protein
MKRTLALLAAGFAGAVIALLALSLAGGALAQGPNGPATQPTPGLTPYGNGQMQGRGRMGNGQMGNGPMQGGSADSLVGMAAAKLNMTQADLVAQLSAGGTLADALTDGGIDPAAFIDEFVASRAERLSAAVAAGTMTQADADARLATVRSMATTRLYQPFTVLGPGGQGPNQGAGCADMNGDGVCDGQPGGQGPNQGAGFTDADGDGVCDHTATGGQGRMGGGRGPRR